MKTLWTPLLLLLVAPLVVAADPDVKPKRDPLAIAKTIDQAIDKKLTDDKVPASPLADDAEFLRRAYLDITGKIPPTEKAIAFLDSKEPDKRAKLIDELLDSSDYGRHFGIIWSDTIVKRDEMNRGLQTAAFKSWLAEQFNNNRGWNEIVKAMLTADGASDKTPEATFFLANRDMGNFAPQKAVDATVNLFMGVMMQCAECHNHPFHREWKQNDFWGMAAFFSRTSTAGAAGAQANRNPGPITVSESANRGGGARPGLFRRPGGGGASPTGASIEIPDPVDPRKRTGKIVKAKFFLEEEPKLEDRPPYRPVFADWLTSKENKYFARSMVNRMWAHFFARGFCPVEDMHDDNPPSHPELLKALTDEFRASDFDLKHLIRSICTSKAYQRTSRPVKGNEDDTQLFSHMAVKVMDPEVLYDSLTQALGVNDLSTGGGFGGRGFGGAGGRGAPPSGRDGFVAFFTTKDETDEATEFGFGIPQFLRLMNSRPFNQSGPVLSKAVKESSPEKGVEYLFLTTLARRPTPEEMKKFTAYVAKQKDAKDGYAGVQWVLLNSAEFVCNR